MTEFTHEQALRDLGPQMQSFIAAVDLIARQHGVAGYSLISMLAGNLAATIGGYDEELRLIFHLVNIDVSDTVERLLELQDLKMVVPS